MKKLFVILTFIIPALGLSAQKLSQTYLDYIQQYKDIAIREMEEYRIPASITLAQGLLESGAGKSDLTIEANNHFGIKCQNSWDGEKVYHDDDAKGECFRKYNTVLESYEDHSQFLINRPRYNFLFDYPSNDYKNWATGLKQAGYATDPTYATRLVKIIEDYNLSQYDKIIVKGEQISASASSEKKNLVVTKSSATTQKTEKGFWYKLFHGSKPSSPQQDSATASQQKVFKDDSGIAEITPYRTHHVNKINGLKEVIALPGDTYQSIADELDMYESELLKANELQYGATPQPGDIVFLQKKKKKGAEDTYVVQKGETIYQISQKTGIRVRYLYRLNGLIYGKQMNAGDVIKLR